MPAGLLLPALALLGFLISLSHAARAQERGRDTPGTFDFFVLALSWSPTYCAQAKASPQQCRSKSRRFVVHGLWPQYARGYPDYCQAPAPYVPEDVITSVADLMPSKGLVLHEWRKHGTCTGLSPEGYFELVRKARARVSVPSAFEGAPPPSLTGTQIEDAFLEANPGLKGDMIALDCDDGRLAEVRICLSRSLDFIACPEVNRRGCSLSRTLAVPAP